MVLQVFSFKTTDAIVFLQKGVYIVVKLIIIVVSLYVHLTNVLLVKILLVSPVVSIDNLISVRVPMSYYYHSQ